MLASPPQSTASKAGSEGCIRVNIGCGHPTQTRASGTEAPSMSRVAAPDIDSDATIQSSFAGTEESEEEGEVGAKTRCQDANDNHFANTHPTQNNNGKRPDPFSVRPSNSAAAQPGAPTGNVPSSSGNRLADAQKKFKPNY
ncbi:hypothetical protein PSTG_16457 [Puccinia striiformis f. sp. tritici PST-78]|uniref:Uncharacterized protein n=1 Tax=Puccinia striiformis f. sp. tritici PST-78 TaxID=1165861 RepID=A0A0L0USV2_9BASI|nr:hypothetical protein PSTG_16457 [Puccinia striiformis f. sp. tritici PST-78]